ncbi:MAG: TRAP transporter small permease subunit [Spirochaetes bacterium]|nr:TRAP transporter small permease subunit [Spirochaetota bacterium]
MKNLEKKNKMIKFWKKFVNILHKVEEYILVFFLSLMIIISFLQIILKIFFKAIVWFDPMIKYTVLWIGMIAAGMATFENKHIKIDIIGRFAKGRLKSFVLAVTNLFASIVSIVLSYASIIYIIKIEIPATDPPPFLNISKWVLLLILPIGFAIIGIRFFFRLCKKIYNFIKNKEDEEDIEFSVDLEEDKK